MKTLGEVLALSHQFLEKGGVPFPRRVAEELLSRVFSLKRLDLYTHFDRPLLETELIKLRPLLQRALKKEPVAYLLGNVPFFQSMIRVSPAVLIPRPETEQLVAKGLENLKGQEGISVLDLCCGSGCIGISLKKASPSWRVALSDLSSDALAIARENAEKNGVEVEIAQGDLLEPWKGRLFDAVFCNPPYVSDAEYPLLDASVRDFEPKMALVAGERGLCFYEKLEKELPEVLSPGAKLFFEIGEKQGKAILELFSGAYWKQKEIYKDWAGRDRFFFVER